MALVQKIFPFKMHLHIFQLEEYKEARFLKWIFKNYFIRFYEEKKSLVWTFKAKFILIAGLVYWALLIFVLTLTLGFFGLLSGLLLGTQSYIFLILGRITLYPREVLNRILVKEKIRNKIIDLKKEGLKVIGITGSYGKTSVKDFLYQILSYSYETLKTPESYNTLFGVRKVIDLELDGHYKYFICEMGAYKRGEIKELAETLFPDHGILTGINEQHLERFGCIENTIEAKFELVEAVPASGYVLVNGNNHLVLENYAKYRKDAVIYDMSKGDFTVSDVKTGSQWAEFTLILGGKKYAAKTDLIGKSNLENILAASSMAFLLGMAAGNIVSAIKILKPVPHRLEIKKWPNGLLVIDDSYNSNVDGFKAALDLLSSFGNMRKVIATPGIVELGDKSVDIHEKLGARAEEICDHIFLVGHSERTEALAEGIEDKTKFEFIQSLQELDLDAKNTILLLENDLTENY